jgi:adenosylcobinamide-GDP ribazoletransferase
MGWLVGGVAAGVWWLAVQLWPPAVASGLSLAATLLLTGAFHEDGFADVCDGFGGGYTKDRVLEIMRDSRVGAFGAIGAVMIVGLKWQAVAHLPSSTAAAVILAAHVLSRTLSVSLMFVLSYVREDAAKAKPLATHLGGARALFAFTTGGSALALLPFGLWWVVLPLLATQVWLAAWFKRRIGGYTGDCLGAAQQIAEVVLYLSVLTAP